MLDDLTRDERLLLLKFVCAFAWTDLEVRDGERRFVERLCERLALDQDERAEVETWLHVAPAPGDVDPSRVPAAHRRTFIEAVRAVIYADGDVDTEERLQLEKLKTALTD
jgi:uncharacterized tellurite resistance protein B-like protein